MRCKLAIIDQDALLCDDFLERVFLCGIKKLLITRDCKIVASVVKGSKDKEADQLKAGKIVVMPYQIALSMAGPYLSLASRVYMATEGEVTLALETESDGSEWVLLTPCTEKFDPDDEHVLILDGQEAMRIGYQLYCYNFSVNQKGSEKRMIDFDEYQNEEIYRMCA
ncbi:MAG: hypothetical protein VR64_07210 [Desulfatitalea sp. BRH_c12]|nr:MAG: hypothetical protein VR64_07210 [Desulfatitalea sp. BRH_c12]